MNHKLLLIDYVRKYTFNNIFKKGKTFLNKIKMSIKIKFMACINEI